MTEETRRINRVERGGETYKKERDGERMYLRER